VQHIFSSTDDALQIDIDVIKRINRSHTIWQSRSQQR